MDERTACAHLKQRFERAGFRVREHVDFNSHGLRFDLDGFDAEAGVGYEYCTAEAGDGWDVDEAVIAKLTELRASGELSILVVDEGDAPELPALDAAIDEFLAEVAARKAPAAKPPPVPKAAKAPKGARKPKRR
ncbi:MAG: hypothetical protein R3B48_09775 [Kofleriaceae bacterium]